MTDAYSMMAPREQAATGIEPFHRWGEPGEDPFLCFYRRDDGFLLRFPGFADFLIAQDGASAACWPVPSADRATLDHLFLNQVLPQMTSAAGKLVFHASAIEHGDAAIAFFGPSGRGKSTLAASFAVSGARFLTDDMLVLTRDDGGVVACPSHASIRMWDDSRDAVVGPGARAAPAVSFTAKSRVLAQGGMTHCDEPRRLGAAYFVGPGEASGIELQPMTGAAAVGEWISHAFLLEVDDRAALARHFGRVASVAAAVPCFCLDYPRRFDILAPLRARVLAHFDELEPR